MDKSIFKLIHDDEINESFRLNAEFQEYEFDLAVLKNSNAWTARVQRQKLCDLAKELDVDVDEYFQRIQEYLRSTPLSVRLKFINSEFIISCTLESSMKVKYFSYKLQKVDYSNYIETLAEKFYTERNDSLDRLITIEKDNNKLGESRDGLQSKLSELVERKKADDEELFSNFVLVLNEKKRRIQHLNELLEAFRRGRPSINPNVEIKKRSKKAETTKEVKKEKKEVVSESDSEENYNTDDERLKRSNSSDDDFNNDANQNKSDANPIPSTSKFDLFDDSPPRHLPKRVRNEASSVNSNCCIELSSKEHNKSKKQNENLTRAVVEDTPNVNFNTQELLDNMT